MIGLLAGVLGATTAAFLGAGVIGTLGTYMLAGSLGMIAGAGVKLALMGEDEDFVPYEPLAPKADGPQQDTMSQWFDDDETPPAPKDNTRAA